MGRGLHLGMVNVILPLSGAGRNHLLATYVFKGLCCITHLCCQLKVLRRHKMLIQLKPTIALPKIKIIFGGIRQNIN